MWSPDFYKEESFELPDFLRMAPGPSPWYLRNALPLMTSPGMLRWVDAGHDGITFLSTPDDKVFAVFDMYCYVLTMARNRFLVWYQRKVQPGSLGDLVLTVIDTDKLEAIDDTQSAMSEMKSQKIRIFQNGGNLSSFQISNSLSEGPHEIRIPDEFKELDELLILASSSAIIKRLCIFHVKPKIDSVEVVPQDWFNEGSFDFGYQWPTRVARNPQTGRVFGEGFRLGVFLLDDTLRGVSKWYVMDPFYPSGR
jgi:hypothetical protein